MFISYLSPTSLFCSYGSLSSTKNTHLKHALVSKNLDVVNHTSLEMFALFQLTLKLKLCLFRTRLLVTRIKSNMGQSVIWFRETLPKTFCAGCVIFYEIMVVTAGDRNVLGKPFKARGI